MILKCALFVLFSIVASSVFAYEKRLVTQVGTVLAGVNTMMSGTQSKACTASIPNGLSISESLYPQVVKLDTGNATCTGTLIGPGTLLTAAHCTGCAYGKTSKKAEDIEFEVLGSISVKGKTIICHSKYTHQYVGGIESGVDMAVVLFDEEKIKASKIAYSKIKKFKSAECEGFKGNGIIVGYGSDDPDAILFDGVGTKRMGIAKVIDSYSGLINTGGYALEIQGHYETDKGDGFDATAGSGDSGGPMFDNAGNIVGVASAGATVPEKDVAKNKQGSSDYTFLCGEDSKKFFESAVLQGASVTYSE